MPDTMKAGTTELGIWPNPFPENRGRHEWAEYDRIPEGGSHDDVLLYGKEVRCEDFGRVTFYRGDGVFGVLQRGVKGPYRHIRFTKTSLPHSMRSLFDA